MPDQPDPTEPANTAAPAPELEAEMAKVDLHPDAGRATEDDEEQILSELYGPPDPDGFYRGTGAE
jgi:hypothetical protein